MPDTPASPITLFPAVLTFSAALLAPVIGAVVGLLSRTSLQRKQQETEYNIKRLELIEKIVGVGKSLSSDLGISVDTSLARSEYLRIVASVSEPEPPSIHTSLSMERHRLPVREPYNPASGAIKIL
jgi:hypothetical protein